MSRKQKAPVKIIGERDIQLHLSNPAHHEQIVRIGKALSSPIRLNILNLLKNTPLSLQEIADILSIPVSSTALHIKILEEAKLIVTETQPGLHGSMRVGICSMQTFHLETFDADADLADNTITLDMPVGNYYQIEVEPTCGLADENGVMDAYDSARTFYSPLRGNAQLIWFQQGFVEYRFPNLTNPLLELHEISFCMELCSEAPGFLEDWPSDITVRVNDVELLTFTSPGDFGGRRGKYTPAYWPVTSTQFGLLKKIAVNEDGVFMDNVLVTNKIRFSDLGLYGRSAVKFEIGIKENAEHKGGLNLFGKDFGDFPQAIVMSVK